MAGAAGLHTESRHRCSDSGFGVAANGARGDAVVLEGAAVQGEKAGAECGAAADDEVADVAEDACPGVDGDAAGKRVVAAEPHGAGTAFGQSAIRDWHGDI